MTEEVNLNSAEVLEALALECAYQRWLGEQRDKRITELEEKLLNS